MTVLVAGRSRRRSPWHVIGVWVTLAIGSWLLVAAVVYGVYKFMGWVWP